MSFLQIYIQSFPIIIIIMAVLWLISVLIRNVSIVDIFWGTGFIVASVFYFIKSDGFETRKIILLLLTAVWGFRLSGYLAWRNRGKGEDFRYRQFRARYGETRYWWISFFQVFLLQGTLMWLISSTLLGAMSGVHKSLNLFDYLGMLLWFIGFIFEAGGDLQLSNFKSDASNRGKVLDKGFWRYTRHPNYFGDSAVWWGYGMFCIGSGSYLPALGSVLMTALIIKVSGVVLLEKTLSEQKPLYRDYIKKTSAFFPWFPGK
jgi:steroid 5-alpha reductase family enzyme